MGSLTERYIASASTLRARHRRPDRARRDPGRLLGRPGRGGAARPGHRVPRAARRARPSTSPARRSTRSAWVALPALRSCWSATSSSSSPPCASGTTSSRTCRPPTRRCASSRQQWAWSFVHPGPDRQARHRRRHQDRRRAARRGRHDLSLQARVARRAAQLLGAGVPAQAGRDPGPRDHGLVRGRPRPARSTSSARRSAASATALMPARDP